eukprot:jgi/Botrbrau1/10430/Bobra.0133s0037.1
MSLAPPAVLAVARCPALLSVFLSPAVLSVVVSPAVLSVFLSPAVLSVAACPRCTARHSITYQEISPSCFSRTVSPLLQLYSQTPPHKPGHQSPLAPAVLPVVASPAVLPMAPSSARTLRRCLSSCTVSRGPLNPYDQSAASPPVLPVTASPAVHSGAASPIVLPSMATPAVPHVAASPTGPPLAPAQAVMLSAPSAVLSQWLVPARIGHSHLIPLYCQRLRKLWGRPPLARRNCGGRPHGPRSVYTAVAVQCAARHFWSGLRHLQPIHSAHYINNRHHGGVSDSWQPPAAVTVASRWRGGCHRPAVLAQISVFAAASSGDVLGGDRPLPGTGIPRGTGISPEGVAHLPQHRLLPLLHASATRAGALADMRQACCAVALRQTCDAVPCDTGRWARGMRKR